VQHEAGDLLADARRVFERNRRAQADAADVVLAQAQAIGKRLKKFRVAGDADGRLPGGRLTTSRQVRNQDTPVAAEGGAPAVKVLQRADEAVTQEQRVARSLVEVPDPPLPDVDELDVLRVDGGLYSPVSICARCSRPL
jgi:hypothetical protein